MDLATKGIYKEHKPIEKKHVQQTVQIPKKTKTNLADLFNHAHYYFSQQQKAVSNCNKMVSGAWTTINY